MKAITKVILTLILTTAIAAGIFFAVNATKQSSEEAASINPDLIVSHDRTDKEISSDSDADRLRLERVRYHALEEVVEIELRDKLALQYKISTESDVPLDLNYTEGEYPLRQVSFDDLKETVKDKRLLLDANTLTGPGIIAFDQQTTSTREYYAYRYVMNNLKEYSTRFILYPYSFSYINQNDSTKNKDFNKGAVFTLKPELLPTDSGAYNYFQSLKTTTDVQFGKAKALYDINIGVLSITDFFNDIMMELTYESTYYCNVMASYMGKYSECMIGSAYPSFKADIKNAGKTAFVYLRQDDIVLRNLLFTADDAPRFQLLILPDYYTGAHDAISKKLGQTGIDLIKKYVAKGGLIYATGKAGYLLELWGILKAGTYNTNYFITSTNPTLQEDIDGCDTISDNFINALLCMNLANGSPYTKSYILSAYMVNKDKVQDMTIMKYSSLSTTLKKKTADGLTVDFIGNEKQFVPFTMSTNYEKGKVIVVNGNPLFKNTNYKVFFNAVLLSMCRNVVFDSYIGTPDGKPVPGGEAGVTLNAKLSFINLFDTSAENMKVHMWFPKGVEVKSMPDYCFYNPTNVSFTVVLTAVNQTSHITCLQTSLGPFAKFSVLVQIEIVNSAVMQAKTDVLMVVSAVEYTDTESSLIYQYDIGALRTNAALGSLLRGALSSSPTKYYPIKGAGTYVDNTLQVENKQDTSALNVEYVAMIPVISPVIDSSDQTVLARIARFLPAYYRSQSNQVYHFPFKKEQGKDSDFLDFKWLNMRDAVLVAEWDVPVKHVKVLRDSRFPADNRSHKKFDILNMNHSAMISDLETVLNQIYAIDSEQFFGQTAQRLMVFVDISKPNGAGTFWPQGVPFYERNPRKINIAKQEIVWIRSDVYFYQQSGYQMPKNLDYTHVISLDRYPKYNDTCVATGTAKAKIEVPGFFDIDHDEGHRPHQYSNELLMYCNRKRIEFSEIEAVTNGTVKASHYLVPISDPDIQQADDVMHFEANADGTGYLSEYPEVKFIRAHRFSVVVDGVYTRQGGMLEIVLDPSVSFNNEANEDPAEKQYITYAPDAVAFYKTSYNSSSKTIKSFFKRGLLPYEGYGKPAVIAVTIENLNLPANFTATLRIYEMKYDISSEETNFEKYYLKVTKNINVVYGNFFSLPALEMHIKMNRSGSTEVRAYEIVGSFARFGVYVQELRQHATVWSSVESHHTTEPGIQAISGGFMTINSLGISAIPQVETATTGKLPLVPSSPSTSRVEWDDLWGRHWVQPLRSFFPDVPGSPAPARNFMMSTTFELTKAGTNQRVMQWTSDEKVDIRVHIKLYNTFQKYFEITSCKDNKIPYIMEKETTFERSRIFEDRSTITYEVTKSNAPNSNFHLNNGQHAVYGSCFDDINAVLQGDIITDTDRTKIGNMRLCPPNLNADELIECSRNNEGIPSITKKPKTSGKVIWNYSPKVDRFYPKGYIKQEMWDMSRKEDDDNNLEKSYRYHMDSNLPGVDYGPSQNPARIRPHNVICQPVYKGLGYSITYSPTHVLTRFPKFKGWWSDNLQNKDHTLLAGQAFINEVSVHQPSSIPDTAWINIKNLVNPKTQEIVKGRLKNVYTCLFNQHRIKMDPDQNVMAYPSNIYQNNIIPVFSDLENDDKRFENFDCTNVYQYSPYNISQVDNYVETPTIRDMLYFSANLRANAYETINIPFLLSPLSKFEGMTKIIEGGKFVYWNPGNLASAYGTEYNGMYFVEGTRADLSISVEVFPKTTTTFKSVLYHLFNVEDPAEVNRQWTYDTYINSYGFGDSAVTIYVGGILNGRATVSPGGSTYARIQLFNNAGFDWNMYNGAMDFAYSGTTPINNGEFISKITHSVQKPLKYNFFTITVPDEIKDYITITPSDHHGNVAPQLFDFMNINVVTIRDGWNAEYYFKIVVNSAIPDSLKGKVYEINVEINESHFDRLPGYNDPTGSYHDYHLTIPPLKIGIPYTSGPYAGKVFYTSGRSTDIMIKTYIPNYWTVVEARLISAQQIDSMRIACGDPDNYNSLLLNVWNSLSKTAVIPVSTFTSSGDTLVSINMANAFPYLPLQNGANPDISSFSVILKVGAYQLAYGTVRVLSSPKVYYSDFSSKAKSEIIAAPYDKTVVAKGAWITVSYKARIVEKAENGTYVEAANQRFYDKDPTGTIKVTVYLTNIGTDSAYNVNITVLMNEGVSLLTDLIPCGYSYSIQVREHESEFKLDSKRTFGPGDVYSEVFFVKFVKINSNNGNGKKRRMLQASDLTLFKSIGANIDLTSTVGAVQVSQSISTPLSFTLVTSDRDSVAVSGTVEFFNGKPIFKITGAANPAITSTGYAVRYEFSRQILALDCESDLSSPTGDCSSINKDWVLFKAISSDNFADDRPIPDSFTGTIRSGFYQYKITTYSELKAVLAESIWGGIAERPVSGYAPIAPVTPVGPVINSTNNETIPVPNGEDPLNPNNGGDSTGNNTNSSASGVSAGSTSFDVPTYVAVLVPSAVIIFISIISILIYKKYAAVRMMKVAAEETIPETIPRPNDPESQVVPVKISEYTSNLHAQV